MGAVFTAALLLGSCRSDTTPEPAVCTQSADDRWVQVGRYTLGGRPGPTFVEILDVEVAGPHVFLCTATQGLIAVDRGDPELPILSLSGSSVERPACQHVEVDGDRVLISNRGHEYAPRPHVTLFLVNDVSSPIELSHLAEPGVSYEGIATLGGGRYAVGMHEAGVAILDSEQGQLREVGRVEQVGNVWDFATGTDGQLYVAAGAGGVFTIDVRSPAAPRVVHQIELPGSVRHLERAGSRLFAAAGSAGVHSLSLTDSDGPTLDFTLDTPGAAQMTAAVGDLLHVADWNDARVYDLSRPGGATLVAVETIAVGEFSRLLAIDAEGDHSYLGEWTGLYDYRLRETELSPDIRTSAQGLRFQRTGAGQQSAQSMIIENEGTSPLELGKAQVSGPFELNSQPGQIPAGARDFIEIRFKPLSDQAAFGELLLPSNDPDECEVRVGLFGNSIQLGVGDPGIDFSWTDIQRGELLTREALLGQVVLLSYFATF